MKTRLYLHIFMFMLLVSLSSFQSHAQDFLKRDGYKAHYYKSLRYGLFVPPDYDARKSYPLVVYLHGSRDTVSRDKAFYQPAFQREHPCLVLTPKCTEPDLGWGDTWHSRMTNETKNTMALVDSLVRSYSVDKNRIYLYGISMGGFGVFYLLSQDDKTFAAAYAICGGSDEKAAEKISKTPFWIFHGSIDDVVPVRLSRGIYEKIKEHGGKQVRYTEYPGVKHDSWENVNREKMLAPWLFAQERGKTHSMPGPVKDFTAIRKDGNSVVLKWTTPENKSDVDKQVWYYRVLRDKDIIAEVDGDISSVTDNKSSSPASYKVIAVNFFFNESESSVVKIK